MWASAKAAMGKVWGWVAAVGALLAAAGGAALLYLSYNNRKARRETAEAKRAELDAKNDAAAAELELDARDDQAAIDASVPLPPDTDLTDDELLAAWNGVHHVGDINDPPEGG